MESLIRVSPAQLDQLAFGPLVLVVRSPEDDDTGLFSKDLCGCALREAPLSKQRGAWITTGEFPTIPAGQREPSEADQIELFAELAAAPHCMVPLRGGATITVGRNPSCDVILSDPSVSSHHAAFLIGDGGTRIVDTDSKNGTSVNGRRIYPDEQPWLQSMDRLNFGRIQAFVCEPRVMRAVLKQDLRSLI